MKISEVTEQFLLDLTLEQKVELICGGVEDSGESADVALVLGTVPEIAKERAAAASQLYRSGRVKYIVPSGGVEWNIGGEKISEARYMARILKDGGVPDEAIILEDEARTTKENMIYAALQINRKTKFYGDKKIIIVTSHYHMKRSVALARTFMPRFLKIFACPSYPETDKNEWVKKDKSIELLDTEIHLIKGLVDHGIAEDFDL